MASSSTMSAMTGNGTPRLDLVTSAQSFLRDPSVARAPLTKKIGFLESKGLTAQEIEMAMGGGGAAMAAGGLGGQGRQLGTMTPPVPQRDWRDIFIMAVVTGTVGMTAISLARSYLLPLIRPSTLHGLEADKDELKRQFDAAEERLSRIEEGGRQVEDKVDSGLAKVSELITDVSSLVEDIKEGEKQRDEEMKNLQDEVEEIKSLIPKLLDKSRTSQESSLSDLQTELKSLKSLLINRRGLGSTLPGPAGGSASGSSMAASSPPSFISGKPQIPAWQLAAAASANAKTNSDDPSNAMDKSKGVEVDRTSGDAATVT